MKRGLFPTFARCVALTIFAVAASSSTYARTLTWNGTSSLSSKASLSAAANWLEDGQAVSEGPKSGDTLVIGSTAYFAEEDFDIGASGLTLDVRTKSYFYTSFKGSGRLTVGGSSVNVVFYGDNTYTGGTTVNNGKLYLLNKGVSGLGTNSTVTLNRVENTDYPQLAFQGTSATPPCFVNDIVLVNSENGAESWTAIQETGALSKINGSIESDCDFAIESTTRGLTIEGGISASGKTVTLKHQRTSTAATHFVDVKGAIDANVVVEAYGGDATKPHIVRFFGESTVITNSLTVNSGTNRFDAAASWAGTNVTVCAGGMLELQGAGNLSSNACLAVEDGGIVKIASGVTNWISQLVVAGESLDVDRDYTAADLPGVIEGAGALHVQPTTHYVWTGGTSQFWSEPSNWDRNEVPGDGAIAVFNAAVNVNVTNATAVSIGAAGLTLVANGGTVNFRTPLEGAGRLTVTGISTVHLFGECTYTGGTLVEGSVRLCPRFAASPLGTGDVFIDGTAGQPCILALTYNTTFPNNFIVSGVITNNPYTDGGKTSYGAIQVGQTATFNGSITCDDDILITDRNGILTVNGDISVPADKTVRLCNLTSDSNNNKVVAVNGLVSGNLSVEGIWPVRLNANAVCTGTNVVATGSDAVLRLSASSNLNEACALTLLDGAKLDIESGVRQRVAAFTVGTAVKPEGSYNSSNCRDGILGAGVLRVGPRRGCVISFR